MGHSPHFATDRYRVSNCIAAWTSWIAWSVRSRFDAMAAKVAIRILEGGFRALQGPYRPHQLGVTLLPGGGKENGRGRLLSLRPNPQRR